MRKGWGRLAKNLKAEIDEECIEACRGAVSLPFEPGEHQRIAVKIVDDRGIESLKVIKITESIQYLIKMANDQITENIKIIEANQ